MEVLRTIENFLRQSGMSATRFGLMAAHDRRLVADLRRGRRPGRRMVARILAFIAGSEGK